jgi:hypothetical protein
VIQGRSALCQNGVEREQTDDRYGCEPAVQLPASALTRPFTPISKSGVAHGETYVVCLDCAKQFAYDFETMRMGKAIEQSHDHYVVLPKMPRSRKTKVRYALGIGVPLAVLIGSMFALRADDRAARL